MYEIVGEVSIYVYDLVIVATVSTPGIKDLTQHQRKCLFRDEMKLDVSPIYTPVACEMQCKYQTLFKACNCVPPIFQFSGKCYFVMLSFPELSTS